MNMYRVLGDRIGTSDARDLAQRLVRWHDAMVTHLRVMTRDGRRCTDGCPHDEARSLWSAALGVFGSDASSLTFLQRYGGARLHHEAAIAREVHA